MTVPEIDIWGFLHQDDYHGLIQYLIGNVTSHDLEEIVVMSIRYRALKSAQLLIPFVIDLQTLISSLDKDDLLWVSTNLPETQTTIIKFLLVKI